MNFSSQFIASIQDQLRVLESLHELPWILTEAQRLFSIDDPKALTWVESVVKRRSEHEPLAYILGHWAFRDHEYSVGPGVLIPRPETEELVEMALHEVVQRVEAEKLSDFHLADLGAGTGCIGLSLLRELAEIFKRRKIQVRLHGWLVEQSSDAFRYLEENSRLISVSVNLQVHLIQGDWQEFQPSAAMDLVCSNPPYVSFLEWQTLESSVKDYEPPEALHAQDPSLDPDCEGVYRSLLEFVSSERVAPQARIWMELGPAQAPWVESVFREGPLQDVTLKYDMTRRPRFLTAKKILK